MINFVTGVDTPGNNTVIKVGGWDESALLPATASNYYAGEFPTVPGTWTLSIPYVGGGVYWMGPNSAENKLANIDRFYELTPHLPYMYVPQ